MSLWTKGTECIGPPSIMMVFNETTLNSPPQVDYVLEENVSGMCGYSTAVVDSGCCWGFYNSSATGGYTSMMVSVPDFQSQESFVKWTPVSAIESRYCSLSYFDTDNSIRNEWIIADGSCQNSIKCLPSNELQIFSTTDCQIDTLTESYPISNTNNQVQSNSYGTANLSMVMIENGQQSTVWVAYLPVRLNII